MGMIKLEYVIRYSSQDEYFKAENLLQNPGYRPWLCSPDDKSGRLEAEFQLETASCIEFIDIGNFGCCTIEIQVGKSAMQKKTSYHSFVPAVSLINLSELKEKSALNSVYMLNKSNINQFLAAKKWDRIKVICSQPYKKQLQFGLSFLCLRTTKELNSTIKVDSSAETSNKRLSKCVSKMSSSTSIDSGRSRGEKLLNASKSRLSVMNQKKKLVNRVSKVLSYPRHVSEAVPMVKSPQQSASTAMVLSRPRHVSAAVPMVVEKSPQPSESFELVEEKSPQSPDSIDSHIFSPPPLQFSPPSISPPQFSPSSTSPRQLFFPPSPPSVVVFPQLPEYIPLAEASPEPSTCLETFREDVMCFLQVCYEEDDLVKQPKYYQSHFQGQRHKNLTVEEEDIFRDSYFRIVNNRNQILWEQSEMLRNQSPMNEELINSFENYIYEEEGDREADNMDLVEPDNSDDEFIQADGIEPSTSTGKKHTPSTTSSGKAAAKNPGPCRQCPMCGVYFPLDKIESHAWDCTEAFQLTAAAFPEDIYPEEIVPIADNYEPCPLCMAKFHKSELEKHAANCSIKSKYL